MAGKIRDAFTMVYQIWHADEPDYCFGEPNRSPLFHPKWNRMKTPIELNRAIEDGMRDCFPTVVTVDPREARLKDWIGTDSGWCVSQKVKNLIESMEPNVHQFFDVEIRYGKEKYDYYILKFGISEDCYDLEKSDVEWKEYDFGEKKVLGWLKKFATPLAFRRTCVENKHLWQNNSGQWMVLISGKLHDLFVEHNVTGVKYEKQIVLMSE